MDRNTARAAEQVARQSYGKLIAFLAARSRDVPTAEDALSEALATALRVWPERGIPHNPEAWLLTTARRNLGHMARRRRTELDGVVTVAMAFEAAEERMNMRDDAAFPDERIKLLFACTHPAIDSAVHTPLMLQTVLGIDAGTIAQAFVVSPAAMSQRLVRAKIKIRDAGIPFHIPEKSVLPQRLDKVLAAIYAAYGLGWDGLDGQDENRLALTNEAIWLARALLETLPGEPEVLGLLSLMLYCEARRAARRDAEGNYVPLDEQDTDLWNAIMIAEADRLLQVAGTLDRFGPFQCQAAIQSVHAQRRRSATTDWQALETLYGALMLMKPTLGCRVSEAAVIARSRGAQAALAALDAMDSRDIAAYQPYWAVRAHLLAEQGNTARAFEAYTTAIGLSQSQAVRRFLSGKQAALAEKP
jgi:RNA polymerase sigma-70 factor (ECF subfamily)